MHNYISLIVFINNQVVVKALRMRWCADSGKMRQQTRKQRQDELHETGRVISQQTRDIVGLMLGQRRRRWANINPTMAQCLVFAGYKWKPINTATSAWWPYIVSMLVQRCTNVLCKLETKSSTRVNVPAKLWTMHVVFWKWGQGRWFIRDPNSHWAGWGHRYNSERWNKRGLHKNGV